MDISINAIVSCSEGPCGQSTCVILKPTTHEITHLVVSNELFPENDYLVTLDHVMESTPNRIQLNCSREELAKVPIFNTVEFVPSDLTGFPRGQYRMWPYYSPTTSFMSLEKEYVPADELAIRRGAGVEAVDRHAGRVDEFLINPENDHFSYLVMREGHLWGQKDVTIPMSRIDHFADNTVYLKLNKQQIEGLPTISVQHNRVKSDKTMM